MIVESMEKGYETGRYLYVTKYQLNLARDIIEIIKRPSINTYLILDVGCGSGRLSKLLVNDCDVLPIGLDVLIPPMIIENRKKEIIPIVADALYLTFKRESFDFVIVANLFTPFNWRTSNQSKSNIKKILFSIRRLLKRNGIVYLDEMTASQQLRGTVGFWLSRLFAYARINLDFLDIRGRVVVSFQTSNWSKEIS